MCHVMRIRKRKEKASHFIFILTATSSKLNIYREGRKTLDKFRFQSILTTSHEGAHRPEERPTPEISTPHTESPQSSPA